jgi:hypothetical protein
VTDPNVHYRETKWGFQYGAATVERCCSDRLGVVISVTTPYRIAHISVSPTGRVIRVSNVSRRSSKGRQMEAAEEAKP